MRWAVIKVVHRGEYGAEHQVGQRLQGVHQHRIVRGLADGQVEGVIEACMLAWVYRLLLRMGRQHLLVTPSQQHEIRLGATQRRQARRFAFEQAAYFQQVIQGARL